LIGLKKNSTNSIAASRLLVEAGHEQLSIVRQCELLGLNRASYYYLPGTESPENLAIMRLLDEQYLKTPFYGVRRMLAYIQTQGYLVNIKRIRRLLRLMGLEALYPKANLSKAQPGHQIFPYLLKGLIIDRVNQVWSSDITYIPVKSGFFYLVAIMDWYSRYVLAWRLSNSLEASFCLEALEAALKFGRPEIFNTDQGAQFTSDQFTGKLLAHNINISMDSRGRALDNIFIERLWRSLKYEYVYLNAPATGQELYTGLAHYFQFYNDERPHQGLSYAPPATAHFRKY
jgi:putative transposase